MKTFLAYMFGILAIIFGFWGLSSLILYFTVLNPETYKGPLESSGIYTQTVEVLKDQTEVALLGLGDEAINTVIDILFKDNGDKNAKSTILKGVITEAATSMIQKQSGTVVDTLFNKIDVKTKLQYISEKTIDETTSWLKGENNLPKAFKYIPSKNLVDLAEKEGILKVATIYVFAEITGITDLPKCQTKDQVSENLVFLENKEYKSIYCTSEVLAPVFLESAQNFLPEEVSIKIQAALQAFMIQYNIQPVLEGIFSIVKNLSGFKESMINLRGFLDTVKNIAFLSIILSAVFAFVSVLLFKKNRLSKIISIYFVVSVTLFMFGVMNRLFIVDMLSTKIGFDTLVISENISVQRNTLMVQSLEEVFNGIMENIYQPYITWGLLGSVILGGILIIIHILSKKEPENTGELTIVENTDRSVKKK
jgi:hypothetical protein